MANLQARQRTEAKPKRAARAHSGEHSTHASATKRGPGRHHSDGHEKVGPIKDKGAPLDFVLHKAHARKSARRAAIELAGSFRQFRRARSAPLRAARVAA